MANYEVDGCCLLEIGLFSGTSFLGISVLTCRKWHYEPLNFKIAWESMSCTPLVASTAIALSCPSFCSSDVGMSAVSLWEGYCFWLQQSGKGYLLTPDLCSLKAHSCFASATGYKQQLFTVWNERPLRR